MDRVMQFGSTKLIYPPVSAQTEHSSHCQEPNISINSERIIPQQVEAEFEQAQGRWSYGIYQELKQAIQIPFMGHFQFDSHKALQ